MFSLPAGYTSLDYRQLAWNPNKIINRTKQHRKISLFTRLLEKTTKLSLQNILTIYKNIFLTIEVLYYRSVGKCKCLNLANSHRFLAWVASDLRWVRAIFGRFIKH